MCGRSAILWEYRHKSLCVFGDEVFLRPSVLQICLPLSEAQF